MHEHTPTELAVGTAPACIVKIWSSTGKTGAPKYSVEANSDTTEADVDHAVAHAVAAWRAIAAELTD